MEEKEKVEIERQRVRLIDSKSRIQELESAVFTKI